MIKLPIYLFRIICDDSVSDNIKFFILLYSKNIEKDTIPFNLLDLDVNKMKIFFYL